MSAIDSTAPKRPRKIAVDRKPRDLHSRETRERILRAAARLIINNGVANTSLADIAREARISKGTLFYHYPSKGDLVFDISERHMSHITEKIFRWVKNTAGSLPPEKVLRMVYDLLLTSEKRAQIHVYLVQEALTGDSSLRERFSQEYRRWRELVEQGLQKILPPDGEFTTLARIIVATIDGFLLQSLLVTEQIPLDNVARYLTR
ncbi:MAG TPA: TetR/AcrR family transcriptional regulator [Spirochaetia bacterium]|nr:TetR/AcrR family transcriptional regulator [Spirochaetia bacterium]